MKYIDNAKEAFSFLSIRVAAVWAIVFGIVANDPTFLLTAYNALPPELQQLLPPWVRMIIGASAMIGTIFFARIVKQKPKADE